MPQPPTNNPPPPPSPAAALGAWFAKWWGRVRAFCMLAGAWGFLFSVISLIGFRAGFEYDDGLVYSSPAFQAAGRDFPAAAGPDYWNAVNRGFAHERVKPAAWLTAWTLKCLGVRVELFLDRSHEGADSLESSWRNLADAIHFTQTDNEKYELLERHRFMLYAAASDAGIIQARKAGVWPLRLRKGAKSTNPLESSPGKFGERILPLSGF